MSDIAERVRTLSVEIRRDHPSASVDVETFLSGAVMLEVRKLGRVYLLAWSPSTAFGVDEVRESDQAFDSGYRFHAETYDEAASELRRLLEDASSDKTP